MGKVHREFPVLALYGIAVCSYHLNVFESMSILKNGQENSNVQKFLQDLHNNPTTFFKSLGLYIGFHKIPPCFRVILILEFIYS